MLGRVIVWDVKVFLMDELLLNLDVKFCVVMCLEIFKLYYCFGIIIIYVIYD